MSIESDAHLSYLFHWAFLMVARILGVALLGGVAVAVGLAAMGADEGTAIALGAASWPLWVIGTIYTASAPKASYMRV